MYTPPDAVLLAAADAVAEKTQALMTERSNKVLAPGNREPALNTLHRLELAG
jgi:hypothetical protein